MKGYDEADAFEFICDGDDDGGIDGLLLETHEGARDVVTVFQSKYPQRPSMVGDGEIAEFIGRGDRLQQVDDLMLLVEPSHRGELRRLVERFKLEEKINASTVTFRLHFVSAGYVGPEGLKVVKAKNHTNPDYVKIWDIDALGPAIDAFNALAPAVNRVPVPVARGDRLVVEAGGLSRLRRCGAGE